MRGKLSTTFFPGHLRNKETQYWKEDILLSSLKGSLKTIPNQKLVNGTSASQVSLKLAKAYSFKDPKMRCEVNSKILKIF